MESSSLVVLRALVMLACLVSIPLAAIFGTSLPGMVEALKNGRLPFLSSDSMPREMPYFQPAASLPNAVSHVPRNNHSSVVAAGFQTPLGGPSGHGPGVVAAGQPLGTAGGNFQLDASTHPGPMAGPGADSVPGQLPEQLAATAPRPLGNSPSATTGSSTDAEGMDRFTQIQQRLRQLGATYYLLESWGSQQHLYRFYCKMAIGGNANYTRYFEATDSDPLRAMTQVLEHVESWQAARQ